MADLSVNFAGIRAPNPFWVASGPPANTGYQAHRAFDAGWGGVVWKTIGEPIVNVSSRAAEIGGAGEWVHYAASKGALESLTVGAARELAARGIRVNAVSPGLIETDLHARAGLPDRLTRLVGGVPMGRTGSAEEVAEAVLWLASDAASYITGAIIPISGGR